MADFLGNYTVYSKGFANPAPTDALRIDNATALCQEVLEPLFAEVGPLSLSYGYISPELSRAIVTYQDPDKPSHHRFDLGAAVDVCAHKWVQGDRAEFLEIGEVGSSPIMLAHLIDSQLSLPYSRMITYSESPYICLAASHREIADGKPRRAFYENRYEGVPKAKPKYLTYSSDSAKLNAFNRLVKDGLEVSWQGAGYPTYHGGGRQQYHHIRVSKYTMLSDWLFHLQSISEGGKNIPSLNLERVEDSFAAAGLVFDWVCNLLDSGRVRIASGYLSPHSKFYNKGNDWAGWDIKFSLSHPDTDYLLGTCLHFIEEGEGVSFSMKYGFVEARVDVDRVLESEYWAGTNTL